jgi:putative hydrolase of HD superfamily
MIQKDLIEKIYVAASMQRWMDHIRPVEFTELDKQAHKMTIAFIIAKYEELIHGKGRLDWIKLIEGVLRISAAGGFDRYQAVHLQPDQE